MIHHSIRLRCLWNWKISKLFELLLQQKYSKMQCTLFFPISPGIPECVRSMERSNGHCLNSIWRCVKISSHKLHRLPLSIVIRVIFFFFRLPLYRLHQWNSHKTLENHRHPAPMPPTKMRILHCDYGLIETIPCMATEDSLRRWKCMRLSLKFLSSSLSPPPLFLSTSSSFYIHPILPILSSFFFSQFVPY